MVAQAEKSQCPAAAVIAGAHVPCEEPAPHDGWAHRNSEHEIIWRDSLVLRWVQ